MTATAGKIGYGTLIKAGSDASPQVFSTIAEVRKIGNFGSKRGLVDMTNFDSANTFMEYILAMKDGAQISVECNFLPNNVTQNVYGLIRDHNNGTTRDFRIVMPGAFGTFSFSALVLEWNVPQFDPQQAITATFTLKISGPITWVP